MRDNNRNRYRNRYMKEENVQRDAVGDSLSYRMRSSLRRKKKARSAKLRLLFVLIAAVWIFVVVQAVAGAMFERNSSIATAFSASKAGEQQGTLEITANYTGTDTDENGKKQILYHLAEKIGLVITGEPTVVRTEARNEVSYKKQAA